MKRLWIIGFLLLMMTIPAHADHGKNESGHGRGYKVEKKQKKHKIKNKKKKELPPGWRKKMVKGNRLDDDIFYHLEPVPRKVFVTLPPPPPGVSYKSIEGEIVKIDDVNRKILDIITKNRIPVPLPPLPGLR